MLSQLSKIAKSLISSQQGEKTSIKEQSPSYIPTMVTTRNQQDQKPTADDSAEDTIVVDVTPVSSSKRKSHKISRDDQSSPNGSMSSPSIKKRKPLPVRAKLAEPSIVNTRPVVKIPVKSPNSPHIVDEVVEPTGAHSVLKHKKFDSEEPDQEHFFSTAPEQAQPHNQEVKDSDDESSEDDAPEEVGAEFAAREANHQAQNAAEAIKAAEQKRKRGPAKTVTKTMKPRALNEELHITEGDERAEALEQPMSEHNVQIPISGTSELFEPEVRSVRAGGDDLMSDAGSSSLVQTVNPRKQVFVDTTERAPKDRRVGSTIFRVTKTQNKSLAPKYNHDAKRMKETLVLGRSRHGVGAMRKPAKQGFFKK